jgi:hypothetical protein
MGRIDRVIRNIYLTEWLTSAEVDEYGSHDLIARAVAWKGKQGEQKNTRNR